MEFIDQERSQSSRLAKRKLFSIKEFCSFWIFFSFLGLNLWVFFFIWCPFDHCGNEIATKDFSIALSWWLGRGNYDNYWSNGKGMFGWNERVIFKQLFRKRLSTLAHNQRLKKMRLCPWNDNIFRALPR